MDNYSNHATIQDLEQPLIQQVQTSRQKSRMKALQAELALLAPEEHPALLDEIENCVWQNMPGFSMDDKRTVMANLYCAAASRAFRSKQMEKYPDLIYSPSQQAADWWKNEGSAEMLRRERVNRQIYAKYY